MNQFLKIGSVILFFILITPATSLCQKNHIKFSIITLKKLGLSYERETGTQSSVLLHYKKYHVVYDPYKSLANYEYKNNGARIMIEYRLYSASIEESRNRFYLGPNISFGNHEISYAEKENGGLNFFSWPDFIKESTPQDLINSRAIVRAKGLGMKVGYQYSKKRAVFDIGINLTSNKIQGTQTGLELSTGEKIDFKSDITGFFPEVYLGFGFSF